MTATDPGTVIPALDEPGAWWCADTPERVVYGTLKFDGVGRPRLELIGMLRPLDQLAEMFRASIVLGVTTRGQPVTLWHCHETGNTGQLHELRSSVIEAQFVFVGEHFASPDALRFRSLSVAYDHLAQWAGLTGIQMRLEPDETGGLKRLAVDYAFPRVFDAVLDDFTLRLGASFSQGGDRLSQIVLQQTLSFTVIPREPLHMERYLKIVRHLQNFLSLGVGLPVYPTAFDAELIEPELADASDGSDSGDDRAAGGSLPLSFARRVTIYRAAPRRGDPFAARDAHKMLFTLRDIAEDFEACVRQWFGGVERLEPIYNLYFATLYGASMYEQTRFLNLAQAVESYHRRTDDRTCTTRALFKGVEKRLQDVIKDPTFALTDDVRQEFRARLAHFNDLSLRTRVEEVYDRCGELATFLIPDRTAFVTAVVQTRNYLTHYGKKQAAVADDALSLYVLARRLRYLLDLTFLREIGLSPEAQRAVVMRHESYLYFRHTATAQDTPVGDGEDDV